MQALEGTCPNTSCKNQIYFLSGAPVIECIKCKQQHEESTLLNVKTVSSSVIEFLQNIQKLKSDQIKKKTEALRVKGLSNYGCKLISPLLTKYGLDKSTQEVKLLRTMGQGDAFNCSHLCNRAFMIEPENLHIPEYGRDTAAEYLTDTLKEILHVNGNEERLVPIYADGDGHCLLHAISRALVGRELFWHPLLTNLKEHFTKRQSDYKALLGDFIQDSEWNDIIKEADPNYLPAYGETHGLRNIHVFGLANVLHRPIILIDSLEGMRSKGDYSAVFLPALVPIEQCKGADGSFNKPIVIAWSSKGHNHFVPLVGIKDKPVPRYPVSVLPKVWGLSQVLLYNYIEFQENSCIIGGAKTLSEGYLKKLVDAMNNHYQILNGVAPSIVADCYQYIYKPSGVVGMTAQMVTEAAHAMVKEERLYRCLSCNVVQQQEMPCSLSWLEPGGKLYDIALKTHGTLKNGYHYKFPYNNNIVCSYDKAKDKLLLVQDVNTLKCKHCEGSIRLVKRDGSAVYFNGDQLPYPASSSSRCGCGFKHYWDGKQYDNLPLKIPVSFEWTGQKREDVVHWFQNEPDPADNSNAFELAQKVVHKHFPGEFGSERVVQKVVEQIFRETLKKKPVEQGAKLPPMPPTDTSKMASSSKIILTGPKSKTVHKEELYASKTEEILRKKIEHGASVKQKRLSSSPMKQTNIETSPNKIVNIDTSPNSKSHDLSPPLPNEKTSPVAKVRRVRISTSDKGNLMYALTDQTSYEDIQNFIEENFNIKKELQIIKYGFPPKLLEPVGDSTSPLQLKHGERLVVHIKKVYPLDTPMEVDSTVSEGLSSTSNRIANSIPINMVDDVTSSTSIDPSPSTKSNENDGKNDDVSTDQWDRFNLPNPLVEMSNSDDLSSFGAHTSSLLSLLEKVDLWTWACTRRSMFQPEGLFYTQAFKDLKDMGDNKHFSLPYFPKKLFAYNAKADEIYLCLGKTHIPVQLLSQEQQELASRQVKDAQLQKVQNTLPKNLIFPKQIIDIEKSKDTPSPDTFSDHNLHEGIKSPTKFNSESIPPLQLPVPPAISRGDSSKTRDSSTIVSDIITHPTAKDNNFETLEQSSNDRSAQGGPQRNETNYINIDINEQESKPSIPSDEKTNDG